MQSSATGENRHEHRTLIWLVIAVAVLGCIVYLPSITGSWVFDDRPLIDENPYIRSFRYLGRWFVTDFWAVGEESQRYGSSITYWRPGITVTYAIDWAIGAGSPVLFHVMNLLYQAAVAVLSFFVLRRWIGHVVAAFLAALLFCIHPTKAESVAWIAGRTDVICMIAVLLASQGMAWRFGGRRSAGLALEAGGTILAYLCKEQAIVLPAFAVVEAWLALGRPAIEWSTIKKLVPKVLPQAAIAITYLAIRAAVLPVQSKAGAVSLEPVDHLVAVLETMGRFATLTFAPHDLSLQHGLVHSINGEIMRSTPYAIIGGVVSVAFIALAIALRKKWPFVTLGIGFFLVTIAPTSNLVYTGMETLVSERFLYLPLFGLAWIAGELIARVPSRYVRPTYALIAAIAIGFSMLSMSRSADFLDEQAFWARELRLHPDSKQAWQYAVTTANRESRFHDSLTLLQQMNQMLDRYDRDPGRDILFAYQVADVTSRLVPDNRRDELMAIDRFAENILARKPAELHVLQVHLSFGAIKDSALKELVRFQPRFFSLRAEIAGRTGNDAQAVIFADEARKLCRYCSSTVHIVAISYARAGRYDDALQVLDDATGKIPAATIEVARTHIEKAIAAHQEAATARGPAQLRAQAAELAALELWGRAYDVLAPYTAEIEQAPGVARGFAELAFRAGETSVARNMLAATGAGPEVDSLLAEWGAKMGWSE